MTRRAFLGSIAGLAGAPIAARAQMVFDLDVPFVQTPDNVVMAMLEMGRVRADDFLLDLGSGDGRIVITAALRHGVRRGRGIEIDPALVAESRQHARKAGVADRVEFIEQDLFLTDLGVADVITMYLLPDVNIRLRPKLLALRPGVRIVSHDWTMGDWQPEQAQEIAAPQKRLGLRKVANLMAWTVPADVGGRHRALGDGKGGTSTDAPVLEIAQRYQVVTGGELRLGDERWRLATQRIDGADVRLTGQSLAGSPVTLSTRLERQSPTIDWQVERPGQPPSTLRTARIPEPVRSDDMPASPG